MKKISTRLINFVIFALSLTYGNATLAKDEHVLLSINEALESDAAKGKISDDVKLFWGDQAHAKPIKEMGNLNTNKKTNAFNKTEKIACEWAFISAIKSLQEGARKNGSNAVVSIKSNYRNVEISSPTEYMCGSGNVISGVALKGESVQLPN